MHTQQSFAGFHQTRDISTSVDSAVQLSSTVAQITNLSDEMTVALQKTMLWATLRATLWAVWSGCAFHHPMLLKSLYFFSFGKACGAQSTN